LLGSLFNIEDFRALADYFWALALWWGWSSFSGAFFGGAVVAGGFVFVMARWFGRTGAWHLLALAAGGGRLFLPLIEDLSLEGVLGSIEAFWRLCWSFLESLLWVQLVYLLLVHFGAGICFFSFPRAPELVGINFIGCFHCLLVLIEFSSAPQ